MRSRIGRGERRQCFGDHVAEHARAERAAQYQQADALFGRRVAAACEGRDCGPHRIAGDFSENIVRHAASAGDTQGQNIGKRPRNRLARPNTAFCSCRTISGRRRSVRAARTGATQG